MDYKQQFKIETGYHILTTSGRSATYKYDECIGNGLRFYKEYSTWLEDRLVKLPSKEHICNCKKVKS